MKVRPYLLEPKSVPPCPLASGHSGCHLVGGSAPSSERYISSDTSAIPYASASRWTPVSGRLRFLAQQGPSLWRLMAEADHIEPVSADEGIGLPSGLLHIDKGCILLGIQRRRRLIPSKGGMAGGVGAEAFFQDLWFVHRAPFCQKHAGCTTQIGRSLQQRLRNETSCR